MLSDLARGRDNNFNLIRILAALAVLLSHSFSIATGSESAEPLRVTYGLTWGDIAVNIFFIASGFLVTSSLLTRQSDTAFIWARVLRIFPALWLMLLITVFGLGLALTTESAAAYLHQSETWRYLFKNAILFRGIDYRLPGIRSAINGSLWSLTPEVRMYATLLALWLAAAFLGRFRLRALYVAIVSIAVLSGAWYLYQGQFEPLDNVPRLTFMFFTGASFFVFKDRIALRTTPCLLLLAAIAVSLVDRAALFFVLNLSLAYILMYAAYAVSGPIRAFNALGDYSYGVYIYAYPVQVGLSLFVPHISVPALMASSAAITTTLAVLSWHLLEKRALLLKTAFATRTRSRIDSLFRPLLASTRN
jgi:peptidoglycan/LPS O-acetylase OafA/YrhL